jgi:hypothetical protein
VVTVEATDDYGRRWLFPSKKIQDRFESCVPGRVAYVDVGLVVVR